MTEELAIGDLVTTQIQGQIPLEFVVPYQLRNGGIALYLGDATASYMVSYVLYSGTVMAISKEKLVKCTTIFNQA